MTEKFNRFANVRQDFPYDKHGFADIIAYHPAYNDVVAIQACADSSISNRKNKILSSINAYHWISQPSRKIVICGWGKKGARGKRKTWTLRQIAILPEDFKK